MVGGISGYMFGVTGDCGDCMNMTVSADTLSVTCSGWTANDQTCTFEVRTLTQDCGFTNDAVTNSVTLSGELIINGPVIIAMYTVPLVLFSTYFAYLTLLILYSCDHPYILLSSSSIKSVDNVLII